MVTKTTKKAVKKVSKKATKIVAPKVTMTLGQAQTIANFYTKAGKNVPAFLSKKLA